MKKLALLFLLSISAAHANPAMVLDFGFWPTSEDDSHSITVGFEEQNCFTCLSVSHLITKDNTGQHEATGADIIFKLGERDTGTFRLEFGVYEFEEKAVTGDDLNMHVGLGFEAYASKNVGVILSYDVYSHFDNRLNRIGVEEDEPYHLVNIGFSFK